MKRRLVQRLSAAAWALGMVMAPVAGSAAAVAAAGSPVLQLPAAQDLNGVWWASSYSAKIVPVGGGELPFTPSGRQAYEKNVAGLRDRSITDMARYVCVPDGVPRIWLSPYPFQILQTPGQTTILYEQNRVLRVVKMDAKLDEDLVSALPYFSGHSVGRWQGDTLVIESAGFKDTTFLDDTGVPHSDQMRTVERLRKINGGRQLEVQVEVTDAQTFTRPWTARFVYDARPDIRLDTQVCGEKHRDLSAVKGAPQ